MSLPTPEPSPALPAAPRPIHRHYLRLLLALCAVLAVLVALLAVALSEIPALARGPGAQMVGRLIGRPVALERLRIDPLHLRVHIDGLQVGEAPARSGLARLGHPLAGDSAPAPGAAKAAVFASVGSFDLQLSAASLLHGYPVVSAVHIERPSLHLARNAGGQLNVQDLLDRFLKAPSTGPTPALVIRDVVLHDGALTWDDAVTGAHHGLTGMELVLPWLSTRSEDAGTTVSPQFYGRLDDRLLVLYANAARKDRKEALAVHFEVEDLHLPAYTDLVPVPGELQLRDGRFDAHMDLRLRIQPGALPQLSLAGDFILRNLDVRDGPAATRPMVAMDRLEVPVREFRLSDGFLHLGLLSVRGFSAHADRAADGSIDWVRALQRVEAARSSAGADTARADPKPKPAPGVRHVVLDGLDFAGGAASWEDRSTGAPVQLALHDTRLRLGALRWPEPDQVPFQLTLQGDRQEQVALEGTLRTPGPVVKAHATLTRIDLQRLSPYFAGRLPVRVDSAPFTTAADLDLGLDVQGPYAQVHGLQFSLPSVEVRDLAHGNLLVHVHDLKLDGLEADARSGLLSLRSLDWSALETGAQVGTGAARLQALTANWLQHQAHLGTLDLAALRLPADGHGAILHADGIDADLDAQRYALHSLAAADLALPTGLSVGAVRVADAVAEPGDGHYRAAALNAAAVSAPGNNRLGGITLTQADVRLGAQHVAQLGSLNAVELALGGRMQLPLLEANNSRVDLDQHTFSLDLLHLAGLRTDLLRERTGAVNLGTLLQALDGIPGYQAAAAGKPVAAHADASNPATLGGWQGRLNQLKIEDAGGSFRDETHVPAATARWQHMQVVLSQLSTQAVEPARFSLSGQLGEGTAVTLKGRIRAAPLDGKLHLTVQGLHLPEWQAWAPAGMPLQVTGGTFDLDARLQVNGTLDQPRLVLDGSTALADVTLAAAGERQTMVAWKVLAGTGVHATNLPPDVHLQHIELDGLVASLQLQADGAINLTRALTAGAAGSRPKAPPPPAPAGAAASTASPAAPLPLAIDTIDVKEAQLEFQDHYIRPEYAAHLHHVQGQLTGLSSRPDSRGRLTLAGTLDGGASVTVNGLLNPLASPLFLDLQAQVHDFELGPLTSYSTRFTGFPITRGKLSFDVAYRLDHARITASNHLRLDQLTLGEHRDLPGIRSIPMDVAVNLLQDSNGVIEVDLPIEGTLSDPQFSLGGIIGQLVSRAVERAVTAPFRWLGALFGGEHAENFGWVGFAAGSDALDTVAIDKLQRLAQALRSKPALRVDIRSYGDAVRDAGALGAEARANPDALTELAARRVRAAQDWLTGPGRIDPGRVFVAGADADASDRDPAPAAGSTPATRVQFTLH